VRRYPVLGHLLISLGVLFICSALTLRSNIVLRREVWDLREDLLASHKTTQHVLAAHQALLEGLGINLQVTARKNREHLQEVIKTAPVRVRVEQRVVTISTEVDARDYIESSVKVQLGIYGPCTNFFHDHPIGEPHEVTQWGSGGVVKVDKDWIYILTAGHVVEDMTVTDSTAVRNPVVRFPILLDGTGIRKVAWTTLPMDLVHHSKSFDLAIVKVKKTIPSPKLLFLAEEADFFEPIFMIGFPSILESFKTEGCLNSVGLPSLSSPLWFSEKVWVTSIPAVGGNSGSPVLSKRTGKIVGVLVGGYRSYPHATIIVPFPVIGEWLEKEGFVLN